MYKFIIKPILFLFDPEKIHHFAFSSIRMMQRIPGVKALTRSIFKYEDQKLPLSLFGLEFKNRVGLAAGFDKNALLFEELENYGFGFVEIGTVTPKPQEGNEKPRLFRLPEDQALINRMGFNNDGLEIIRKRLLNRKSKILIGGNIGKNKVTPNENALDDYVKCFEGLHDVVDYFVVNVSSPNTPNLRALQDKEPLLKILSELNRINKTKNPSKPILLKIAPDLTEGQLSDIVEIIDESGIDGVIATNTTIDRSNLKTDSNTIDQIGNGGLSGRPLVQRSTDVIKYLSQKSEGRFPIIGVGGIHSADDAVEKLKAGASLVQIYTGFIYEGPGIVKKINKGIADYLN